MELRKYNVGDLLRCNNPYDEPPIIPAKEAAFWEKERLRKCANTGAPTARKIMTEEAATVTREPSNTSVDNA